MRKADYIIVGSGLAGAVIAKCLKDANRDVIVVEKKNNVGGLCYDEIHKPSGYRYHVYGPHAFRTQSDEMWSWLNSLVKFYPFKLQIKTLVDGDLFEWPPNKSTVKHFCGDDCVPHFQGIPANFEQASLAKMPLAIYEKFVKSYSEKQWGIPAKELWVSLSGRFRIKEDCEDKYLSDYIYQGLPETGFTGLISELLKDIPIYFNHNFDYTNDKLFFQNKLIYTGPIDEFFNFKFGKLGYRGMSHTIEYSDMNSKIQQDAPIYNFPSTDPSYIRSIDWRHWQSPSTLQSQNKKLMSYGFPIEPTTSEQFAYPVLTENNLTLLKKYQEMASENNSLVFCGRLAEYKYYDMNHVIARALEVAKNLLGSDYRGPLIVNNKI